MVVAEAPTAIRLGEAIAALSMATDLANGHALETALRTGFVAQALAKALGCSDTEREHATYAGILRYLGCTAYAHEEASAFGGDDNRVRNIYNPIDMGSKPERLGTTLKSLAIDSSPLGRAKAIATALCKGGRFKASQEAASCEAGQKLASRLGLPEVGVILNGAFDRFDSGSNLCPVSRVLHLAQLCPLLHQRGGREHTLTVARQRSGGQLAPDVVAALERSADEVFEALDAPSIWSEVLRLPALQRTLEVSADQVCQAFADFTDIKSVYTLGFSSRVATTCRHAAASMGLGENTQTELWQAGLLHSLGRVSVPNGIWDKRSALNDAELERVRLYPHYTDRILNKSMALRHLAPLAGASQERCDGSGYHRGSRAPEQSPAMSLLAASLVFEALRSQRAYRPAFSVEDASTILHREVADGRIDYDAALAVCTIAGQPAPERPQYPAELSTREVDVLRLVATAHSNKEIAQRLFISAKTVQHHVAHIYEKADVCTRVGAALFAIEHNLLPR